MVKEAVKIKKLKEKIAKLLEGEGGKTKEKNNIDNGIKVIEEKVKESTKKLKKEGLEYYLGGVILKIKENVPKERGYSGYQKEKAREFAGQLSKILEEGKFKKLDYWPQRRGKLA